MTTSPFPEPQPPPWPHCGHGADEENPIGCPGILVRDYTRCLAHLADAERTEYLDSLSPGSDIDHRGTLFVGGPLDDILRTLDDSRLDGRHRSTPFSESLLDDILKALWDADAGKPKFGRADFRAATFTGDADFRAATFTGDADFRGADFTGAVNFSGTFFMRDAYFGGGASFGLPTGDDDWFLNYASFREAIFGGDANFKGAIFSGDAEFTRAVFEKELSFGPLLCRRDVLVSGAVFEAPVTMMVAARGVRCERARFKSTATLRLRYATVDLTDAVLSFPVAVTAHPAPFTTALGKTIPEKYLTVADSGVRVTSVRGVDAAHLVLTDTDLSDCLFSGAFHLDQLRLEGSCTFPPPPTGFHRWHRAVPYRWSRRRTLAEEHHWRALEANQSAPEPGQPLSPRNWRTGPHHPASDLTPAPEDVTAIYRQLRKAFEDGKNEPGAADFYYGEMEMRRHSRDAPASERWLLTAYWLLAGYGLRASRALVSLAVAIALTMLSLMLWGLPTRAPLPTATGTLDEHRITLSTNKPDLAIHGQLMTLPRADRAARVVMNSVIFRTSGQNLTRAGTYIEMASRLFEPILLLLAVLAIRNRVKR
ncbi:pentapeptide repeat-containing protein [Streptomyces sp. HNM0663]|uniref:Pentapeptide repeat-containing protein n=1 Tax=Streptomyces chengmaiensis TaxID=3040919 RepID=A0ABT6HZM5_9ACTN|nr:pentapeptide repeat-containing protein [Streptomyces chengmaiensis]MDH2394070.1 pentapeptide repeat-containing protein [Streptomyces chengmaiensis]